MFRLKRTCGYQSSVKFHHKKAYLCKSRELKVIIMIIRCRPISMRAGLALLQFDWSKAGLSMDLPVFVYSHTKTGFKFFQYREDIGSFFMCLEIFDFKPRRENLTGLLFCLD